MSASKSSERLYRNALKRHTSFKCHTSTCCFRFLHQVRTKDGDLDEECMFHTFFRSTPNETTIFTRHFSKFRLLCSDTETYRAVLSAALFHKQVSTDDAVFVNVKVVLDVNNTDRKVRSWCSVIKF